MTTSFRPVRNRLLLGVILLAFVGGDAGAQDASTPLDPIATVLDAFRTHQLVALGEGNHNNEQGHYFRLALIRDPRFAAMVNDIVVECGNARYQETIDRFIAGADVPDDVLRKVWQDTTQPQTVWDVPIYEAFFRAVRTVNQALPLERRLRVLLGDPPIDWDTIHNREDMGKWIGFSDRDAFPAGVIQREVLAKNRRALIVYGDMHFQRRNLMSNFEMADAAAQTMVSLLERTTRMFTIWTNTNIDLEAVQADIASWAAPSLTLLRGSILGAKDFTFYLPGPPVRIVVKDGTPMPLPQDQWRSLKMEDQFDALLYVGAPSSITMSRLPQALCADASYMEMRLSRMLLGPFPSGSANPIERLKRYCAAAQPN